MMHRSATAARLLRVFPVLFCLLVPFGISYAQSGGGGRLQSAAGEEIRWSVIAGGGNVGATDGNSFLSGTIGQGLIGRVTNSTGELYQGFWFPRESNGPTSVPNIPLAVAGSRTMLRNHPNPFSTSTTIHYRIADRSQVRLEIFNRLGDVVRVLVDETQESGNRDITWDGIDQAGEKAASGAYLYRITVEPVGGSAGRNGSFSEHQQMLIVR